MLTCVRNVNHKDIVVERKKDYMLKKIRRMFAFQKLRIEWKVKNKHNQTYPASLFNIDRVTVGKGTYGPIKAITYECDGSEMRIGNYCSIGGETLFLLGGEHSYKSFSTYPFSELLINKKVDTKSKGPIVIEDDVWIGERATILSGVHIGQGAIIAAGAVVTTDVPAYAIAGGVPCKVIKFRFPKELIEQLIQIDFSKISKDIIEKNYTKINMELNDMELINWLPHKDIN